MTRILDLFGGLSILQRLLMGLALLAASFASGYGYHAYLAKLDAAKTAGKQEIIAETITQVVTVTDQQAVDRLNKQLNDAKSRAAGLQKLIEDQANATPADIDCRLPDWLRYQLNGDLAAGSR